MRNKIHEIYYNLMMLPAMTFLIIFSIVPMFGIVMAFQKFIPAKSILRSPFIGLDIIEKLFLYPKLDG